MSTLTAEPHGPIAAQACEQPALDELGTLLRNAPSGTVQLLAADGATVALPETVVHVLREVVHCLASGRMITLAPVDKELTTQQAADILNVSRPHVVHLLDTGAIPSHKTGTHRRVRFDDLMAYKKARDSKRRAALDRMTRLGEELEETAAR